MYSCLFLFFLCTLVLFCKVSNFSLQVQGDVLEVLEGLLQALNRVPGTSAMVINEDEAAGEGGDDGDDGDDPEGYPGLFSNNVSCLMLLWPLTMMSLFFVVVYYILIPVRAGPSNRDRVWCDRACPSED